MKTRRLNNAIYVIIILLLIVVCFMEWRGQDKPDVDNGCDCPPIEKIANIADCEVAPTTNDSRPTEFLYLSTYMRGGSSFLGEVFNQNPNVFYWFEPLAGISEKTAWSENQFHLNGTAIHLEPSVTDGMRRALEDIFSCSLDQLPTPVIKHRFLFMYGRSRAINSYKACIQLKDKDANTCLHEMQSLCQRHKLKVIKDIRIPLSEVEPLLAKHRHMKLIHQTRDPRGILYSRWFSMKRQPRFPDDPRLLCLQMSHDFEAFLRLRERHPDAVLWIRYEDLASRPFTSLTRLYAFAGLSVPEDAFVWMYEATHAETDGNLMSTAKRNSTRTAEKWRGRLTSRQIRLINNECSSLIRMLGYPL